VWLVMVVYSAVGCADEEACSLQQLSMAAAAWHVADLETLDVEQRMTAVAHAVVWSGA